MFLFLFAFAQAYGIYWELEVVFFSIPIAASFYQWLAFYFCIDLGP